MFAGKAGSYQMRYLYVAPLLALTTNIRLGWKRPARAKHPSLLQTYVNYRRKKFYGIKPWGYKTFYSRNL